MPLLFTREPDEHTVLGVWLIEERKEELLDTLPTHADLTPLQRINHPQKQLEWLASRVLVYQLLKRYTSEPLLLTKNPDGKPYFENSSFCLSITHSPVLAAVILSKRYEVGIDIEMLSEKALRSCNRFLSEEELKLTAGNLQQTTLYWSAKETLYKLYGKGKLHFKENLAISPGMDKENQTLQGKVHINSFYKLYQIYYDILQNHVLTFSIDKL